VFDTAKTVEKSVEVVFQINGKVRSKAQVAVGTNENELEQLALADANVKRHLDGRRIVKRIIVKDRLVNLVVPTAEKA